MIGIQSLSKQKEHKFIVVLLALVVSFVALPCEGINSSISVSSDTEDVISYYSATLNCVVNSSFDSEQETTVGVVYTTDGTPSKTNGKIVYVDINNIDEEGHFVVELTKLTPATTYKYRTFVIKGGLYFYGTVEEFTTLAQEVTLSAGTASNITCFSTKIKASTLDIPSSFEYKTITYGVCYGEDEEPTVKSSKVEFANSMTLSTFDIQLKALKGNTTYYYRAYSMIDGHEKYSEVRSFTTKPDDVVKTLGYDDEDGEFYCTAELTLGGGSFSSIVLGMCSWKYDNPTVNNNIVTTDELDEENQYTLRLNKLIPGYNYYRAYVLIDGVPHYGEVKQFFKEPKYVDLGLSVKWAECNIGATSPEDYGEYYRWGETKEGFTGYVQDYKFYAGSRESNSWSHYYSRYSLKPEKDQAADSITTLLLEDDAAYIKWGKAWRIPTGPELKELINKCEIVDRKINGIWGLRLTGPNGNSIFLPFSGQRVGDQLWYKNSKGYYWSSTLSPSGLDGNACCIELTDVCQDYTSTSRCAPTNIRPVYDYSGIEESEDCYSINDAIMSCTIKESKDCPQLSYTRTFKNTNWQALYVPFSLSYNDWKDDFEVARANAFYEYDDDDDGVIDRQVLEIIRVQEDNGDLKPNYPYLIRAKRTGEKTITLTDATLYRTEINSYDCSTLENKYTFTGNYDKKKGLKSGNCYFLSGGALKTAANDDVELGAFRWFMVPEIKGGSLLPKSTPAQIKIRVAGEEDTETGIISVKDYINSPVYTLDGRVVNESTLSPGIYIKNGRKYIVK